MKSCCYQQNIYCDNGLSSSCCLVKLSCLPMMTRIVSGFTKNNSRRVALLYNHNKEICCLTFARTFWYIWYMSLSDTASSFVIAMSDIQMCLLWIYLPCLLIITFRSRPAVNGKHQIQILQLGKVFMAATDYVGLNSLRDTARGHQRL